MSHVDEATSARLYLGSDKRTIFSEGDIRARILLAPMGPVDRAKATEIRGYKNGDLYLYPVNGKPPVVPDIMKAPEADEPTPEPVVVFLGTSDVLDFGEHADTKVCDLDEEYLQRLTYVHLHEEWAKAEVERRVTKGKDVKAPKPTEDADDKKPTEDDEPLTLGPDDKVDFGRTHKGKLVRDLPIEYLERLAKGATPIHRVWAQAEIDRRAGE